MVVTTCLFVQIMNVQSKVQDVLLMTWDNLLTNDAVLQADFHSYVNDTGNHERNSPANIIWNHLGSPVVEVWKGLKKKCMQYYCCCCLWP